MPMNKQSFDGDGTPSDQIAKVKKKKNPRWKNIEIDDNPKPRPEPKTEPQETNEFRLPSGTTPVSTPVSSGVSTTRETSRGWSATNENSRPLMLINSSIPQQIPIRTSVSIAELFERHNSRISKRRESQLKKRDDQIRSLFMTSIKTAPKKRKRM